MVSERRADRESHVSIRPHAVLQIELSKVDIPSRSRAARSTSTNLRHKMAKKGREFNAIYRLTAMSVTVERSGDEGRATATARSV